MAFFNKDLHGLKILPDIPNPNILDDLLEMLQDAIPQEDWCFVILCFSMWIVICFSLYNMATTNSDIDISNYPCAVCMGFCLEDEDCIQCNLCFNWFHKECVYLSNKKFKLLGSNINAKFTCTICIHNKKCEVCEKNTNSIKSSISLLCHLPKAFLRWL